MNLVDSDVYEVIVSDRVETKLENGRVKMRGESVYRVRMSQAQYREICGATTTHEWVLLNVFQYHIDLRLQRVHRQQPQFIFMVLVVFLGWQVLLYNTLYLWKEYLDNGY